MRALHTDLAPREGERVSPDGAAIRSNVAWKEMAHNALCERDKWIAEGLKATESEQAANARAADYRRERDAAQARANNAEMHARRLESYRAADTGRFNALYAELEAIKGALAILAPYMKESE